MLAEEQRRQVDLDGPPAGPAADCEPTPAGEGGGRFRPGGGADASRPPRRRSRPNSRRLCHASGSRPWRPLRRPWPDRAKSHEPRRRDDGPRPDTRSTLPRRRPRSGPPRRPSGGPAAAAARRSRGLSGKRRIRPTIGRSAWPPHCGRAPRQIVGVGSPAVFAQDEGALGYRRVDSVLLDRGRRAHGRVDDDLVANLPALPPRPPTWLTMPSSRSRPGRVAAAAPAEALVTQRSMWFRALAISRTATSPGPTSGSGSSPQR